ncbi:MAG: hypothetical protein ABI599_14965 [Flavobacteriales bacterium]
MMKQLLVGSFLFTTALTHAQVDGIYVSDAGNFNNPPWQILRFDANGTNPLAFITTNLNWPQDIVFLEDSNRVLISNLGTNKITKYDATTGVYVSDFATGIAGPTRMKIGPDGLLYVLQWNGTGTVRRYMLNGTYVGEFTTVGVPQSIGLDWDGAGNLYVSSYTSDLVRKFDPDGNDLGAFISADLVGPTNIWFDLNGDLIVSDYDGAAIKRFDAAGTFLSTFITGVSYTEGIAHYPNGNFLIGNGATSSVKQFDAGGTYLQDLIPSGSGGLINPNAIVIRGAQVGVPERTKEPEVAIFYPSVGSIFHLAPSLAGVRSITIRSVQGELTERVVQGVWNADHLAAGMYMVMAERNDRSVIRQRIEVVHD